MSAPNTLAVAAGLRTGAWYADAPLQLDFPSTWDVTTLWPRTPAPLTAEQIRELLEHPAGQPPVRELCRGARRPVVVVDDVNRPTPAWAILPHVFRHFRHAGIDLRNTAVLLA